MYTINTYLSLVMIHKYNPSRSIISNLNTIFKACDDLHTSIVEYCVACGGATPEFGSMTFAFY